MCVPGTDDAEEAQTKAVPSGSHERADSDPTLALRVTKGFRKDLRAQSGARTPELSAVGPARAEGGHGQEEPRA